MRRKSEACEAMREDAMADFEIGAISEAGMREHDEMRLAVEPETNGIEEAMATERVTA